LSIDLEKYELAKEEAEMKSTIATVLLTLGLVFVMAFGLGTAASAEELQPTTMTWVAGGVGGGWYAQAGGLARLIQEKESKIILKVVPGGGVVNPVRVSTGKDGIAWGVTFVDKMAYAGMAPLYKKANPDVRALGAIFGISYIHVLSSADQNIKTLGEFVDMVKAGKAVKVAMPMSGTSDLPLVKQILQFYGITFEDIEKAGGKIFQAVYADMVSLYKDKHVDFVFTHLGLPAAAITEMAVSRKSVLLTTSKECIDTMAEKLGTINTASGKAFIPAGTYKGTDVDIPAVPTAAELLAGAHVPDVVAYTILKIIGDNIQEVYTINEKNKTFDPKTGWQNVAVPLHPGAEKYYKEMGYMK
jgi:TRAP transporter TAXI family solute receptor